jgi:hypothetical protein
MDRHRDVWLPSEENYLRAMYGWVPLSKIATELGRAEQAVNVRRRYHLTNSRRGWTRTPTRCTRTRSK